MSDKQAAVIYRRVTRSIGEWLRDRCMTFADCRLQTSDCRSQIADCKLNDTKNLPNKGDVIKNITSCESEKVAWEQGYIFAQSYIGLIPKMLLAILHRPFIKYINSPGTLLIALIFYSSLIIVIMTSSNAH